MLDIPKQTITLPDGKNPLPKKFRPEKVKEPKDKKPRDPISARLRSKILHRDGYTCKSCNATLGDGAKLHVDHIVPVSRGGRTCEANLITRCETCNLGKGASLRNPPKDDDSDRQWRIKKHKSMKDDLDNAKARKST